MANNAVPSPLHPRKVPSNGSSHGRSPGQSRHGGAASMNALASYFARLAASTPTGSNADSRDGTVHSVMGRGQTRPYQGAGGNTPDPTVHAKANPLQIPNHGGPSAASPAEGPQGCAACANGGDGRVGLPLTASVHRALSRLDFHKRSVMRVGSLGDRLR